jgi:hypothetical protein
MNDGSLLILGEILILVVVIMIGVMIVCIKLNERNKDDN